MDYGWTCHILHIAYFNYYTYLLSRTGMLGGNNSEIIWGLVEKLQKSHQ